MDEEVTQTILQIIDESRPETTQELLDLAKVKLELPEQRILEHIFRLQEEGKIALKKKPTPVPLGLAAYSNTEDARWYWATIAAACATMLAVFLVPEDFFPLAYGRYILGSVFILWLPGYSFVKALFPKKKAETEATPDLDNVERTVLSIGLSLALVPLVGFLLNYTPWGVRLVPIVLSLFALTVVFATVALAREHQTILESLHEDRRKVRRK